MTGMEFHIVGIGAENGIGKLEHSAPDSFCIERKSAMTLYSMHTLESENPNFSTLSMNEQGKSFQVCSLYSGGRGCAAGCLGLPDKVLSLLLPEYLVAEDFNLVLVRIASRIWTNPQESGKRLMYCGSMFKESFLVEKPLELYEYLLSQLDDELHLSDDELLRANQFEVKMMRTIIEDQRNLLKNYTYEADIAEKKQLRAKIKELYSEIQELKTQKQLLETYNKQKDEKLKELQNKSKISVSSAIDIPKIAGDPEIFDYKQIIEEQKRKIFDLEMELEILKETMSN